jgi:hypothetical protein
MSLAVVLLPGPGSMTATLDSVRTEVDPDTSIVRLASSDYTDAGVDDAVMSVPTTGPHEVLTAADLLTFVRAGDRLLPGALRARLAPMTAHPNAVLGIAGHTLVTRDGVEVMTIRAPTLPLDRVELLLHAHVEPAAVMVRAAVLDAAALTLLLRPHGDAVLWSRLAQDHGLLPSGEIAANVQIDPERHGHAPQARVAALLESVASFDSADIVGQSTVRRELLRRLYLEPTVDPALTALDLSDVFAQSLGKRADFGALVTDLQWALERQRDALSAERTPWSRGEVPATDALPELADEELQDLRTKAEMLWHEILIRDATIRRLEAELRNAVAVDGGAVSLRECAHE